MPCTLASQAKSPGRLRHVRTRLKKLIFITGLSTHTSGAFAQTPEIPLPEPIVRAIWSLQSPVD
jgi:hypothetical protein